MGVELTFSPGIQQHQSLVAQNSILE